MALLLGFAAFLSTLLGGLFALKKQDKLHLILGFSAGAVVGVAFFDLLPEALELATKEYSASTVATIVAGGFFLYLLLHRLLLFHPHVADDGPTSESMPTWLGAGSLSVHSFFDGIGIGVGFQASAAVGTVVAIAVLAHDFSDGINTVSLVLRIGDERKRALRWLLVDALAPPLGVLCAGMLSLKESQLGLVLALFCGFFVFIGASDLLPESHHRHPKLVTSLLTVLGAATIYTAVHLSRG